MNYLAHLALTPPADQTRHNALKIGNLLGDFIKGSESTLRLQLPADIVDGIMLHRAIDKYTDSHPAFLASKALLAPERRRFAGIVVDIIYDHFLSLHWSSYHDGKLNDFISHSYSIIETNKEWQLGTLKEAFPLMKRQNWLACYITKDGINKTFERVAQRGKYTSPIVNTHLDFEKNYHKFEAHFHRIYKDLLEFKDQYSFS